MAIYVITGKPRHGKTYFIAKQIPRWLNEAKEDGLRIFSNVKINYNLLGYSDDILGNIYNKKDREDPNKLLFYWKNIDTWNFMQKGRIIVDEAQRYFNARKWAMLSEETEIKLQQHGKEDLDIWATTQHYSRIDITLRILVESFFKVEMIWGSPDNKKSWIPKRARMNEFYLEDLERVLKMSSEQKETTDIEPVSTTTFFIRKKFWRLYDTRATIGASEPMPLKHLERTCPDCGYRSTTHV